MVIKHQRPIRNQQDIAITGWELALADDDLLQLVAEISSAGNFLLNFLADHDARNLRNNLLLDGRPSSYNLRTGRMQQEANGVELEREVSDRGDRDKTSNLVQA